MRRLRQPAIFEANYYQSPIYELTEHTHSDEPST